MNKEDKTLGVERGEEVTLVYHQEYQEGDKIFLELDVVPAYVMVQLDDAMGEHMLYLTHKLIAYEIPYGEKKSCYSPKCFSGNVHVLTARLASEDEKARYRNLALNPYDSHESTNCFPHGSANVETRGESIFAAKNAMNGNCANKSHGKWPYESWGINRNPDATMKVEFGRTVTIDKVVLYTRADFPHDSYWTKATLRCSDDSIIELELEKTEKPQSFHIEKKEVEWVQLEKLIKAEDGSPFPALSQIEVYGW